MKKGMLSVSCGMLLMVISGLSQATEISLEGLHRNMGEQLFDGDILATGRIICRERHTGFHIQMNARQVEGRPGHYIVQGSKDTQSKLWVRL
ncbi:aggregative adherence fimbria II minor subunit AafB, partial [Escherichia coli]|nr:aggregative adherence fimbria II minor subunit AafB [Escherichia coli]